MNKLKNLKGLPGSNRKGVKKFYNETKERLADFQMESETEARLMIEYLKKLIKQIKKEHEIRY